jgi:thiol-disulfide isomerase/thioredoxin
MKRVLIFFSIILSSFHLQAQDIKRWKMNDLLAYIDKSDSALVVNFWATFCGPCIEEIPYFQTISEKYKRQKVNLLLVSLDFKEYYPQEKPDEFCPKIDSSWSEAMPATLFVNKTTGYRKFIEAQLKPDEVETEIKKVIGLINH